ncbi:MAG: hypothetical protein ACRDTZ_07285 [Pseudonocardiaceae bacterium]
MRRIVRASALAAAVALAGLALAGCEQTQQERDAATSQSNINKLVGDQPVQAGNYSPTREQIANWTRTWQSGPGKLAYTYLFTQGQNQPIGYYVLIGPPVSYAANATQPYTRECGSSSCVLMPNAGQDGAFYNQGSGTNQFYGKDATTGRQLEWGGTGVWYLLSDKPLRLQAPPLGDAVIK